MMGAEGWGNLGKAKNGNRKNHSWSLQIISSGVCISGWCSLVINLPKSFSVTGEGGRDGGREFGFLFYTFEVDFLYAQTR